ncbi:hypothetical protein V5799_004062 [Amblyomma americanum]|uniref:Beta-galactosidase galactose-binding domain-containing protein n=1 Tax=Amblyomma americanum TaxID=6943 RepID=A0AAQ4D767_AMBAM
MDDRLLTGWEMRPIDLSGASWLRDSEALAALRREGGSPKNASTGLAVYAANISIPQDGSSYDTFLRLDDFRKGVAFLNGFNLGRYWNPAGPQSTLYVPGVLFRSGVNLLVLLELESTECSSPDSCSVNFLSKPNFDAPVRWPL